MFFSENNRLSRPHFDWPLLVASYMLALYGVLAITIANFDPSLVRFRIWLWMPITVVFSCFGL